jgi:hypothetical protein
MEGLKTGGVQAAGMVLQFVSAPTKCDVPENLGAIFPNGQDHCMCEYHQQTSDILAFISSLLHQEYQPV